MTIVQEVIKECITYWDDEETQKLVREHVLDPLIIYITDKLYPYLMISGSILLLLIILVSMTLWLILVGKNKA